MQDGFPSKPTEPRTISLFLSAARRVHLGITDEHSLAASYAEVLYGKGIHLAVLGENSYSYITIISYSETIPL